MHVSIEKSIQRNAVLMPDKVAICVDNIKLSYGALANRISATVTNIRDNFDLRPQSRVILFAEKNVDFVVLYFALHCLNVIVLPIDVNISTATFVNIRKEVSPGLIVGNVTLDGVDCRIHRFDEVVMDNCLPCKNECLSYGYSLDDIADIMYTSGTTGASKGVMLSHRNLLSSAVNIASFIGNTSNDTEVLALPICHSFGLGRLRSVMLQGGTIVFFEGFSNVKGLFKTIHDFNATGFSLVPASWEIIRKMSGDRISMFSNQLKYVELGSANLSVSQKLKLLSLLPNTRLCMHYGLTEASRSLFMEFHANDLTTIGSPVGDVSVRIMDDHGDEVGEGEKGEICIKGSHVTNGYWKNLDYTGKSFYNDYFRTGDIGYKSNGLYYLTGRIKDIINVGGKKVSAIEIENIIKECDGILECACVGFSDPIMGELVKAFIVTSDDFSNLEDLKSYLSSRMETYKLPSSYEFIDHLPKTANGKIKKYLLK